MKADKPWWVKQRRFVVPATLQVKIKDLPEEIQVFYCFIVSKVVIETKKRPTQYKGISSKTFKNFIGSEYRDYLNTLKDWQIIEINDQYLNDADEGFCKSYRLHPKAVAAKKVRIRFQKKVVQPLRDKSQLTDDVADLVYRNLKRLTVRADLLPQADVIDDVDAETWAERIHFEQFNVHYSSHAKRVMLTELETLLPSTPQVIETDDSRTDQLKGQIDRLDAVLKKRQAHVRRQRELDRQNRQNTGRK